MTLFDGITTQQLDEAVIQVALQNVKDDPAFDVVASRLLVKTIYKRVLGDYESAEDLKQLHVQHFEENVRRGVEEGLLDERLTQMFDFDRLAAALEPSRDELLKYIGVVTLNNRYGIKGRNGDPLEVPQYFWMRIAMGLSLNEENPTDQALKFYEKMSKLEYLAAGSTLVNGGTSYPQLANCFVMEMQDDIEHIAKTTRDVMWLTKGNRRNRSRRHEASRSGITYSLQQHHVHGPHPLHAHHRLRVARGVPRGQKVWSALLLHGELAPGLPRVP